MQISCEHCGKKLKANPDLYGRKVRCPACRQAMVIPGQPVAVDEEVVELSSDDRIDEKPQPPVGNWSMVDYGLTAVIVGTIVLIGATTLAGLSEGLMQVSSLIRGTPRSMRDALGDPPRPDFQYRRYPGDSRSADADAARRQSIEDYNRQMRAYQERSRKYQANMRRRQSFAGNIGTTGLSVYKFSLLVSLLGSAIGLAGYVLCLRGPALNSLPLFAMVAGLVTLCHLLLQLIFKVTPALTGNRVYDHLAFAISGGSYSLSSWPATTGHKLFGLLIDFAVAAEPMLFLFFLIAVTITLESPALTRRGYLVMAVLAGCIGALLLTYFWTFVNSSSSRWPTYFGWLIHWGVNVFAFVGLLMYLRLLFGVRRRLRLG